MTTPRFTLDPRSKTVVDTATGIRVVCDSLESMMKLHAQMERAHRPAAVVSERKQRRLATVQERKEAGR